jgi:hypothetical protein
MNRTKVVFVVAGVLLFFVGIRILFNPRPVVYVLSFPYSFIAGSAASRKLWLTVRTRLRVQRRTALAESAESQ